MHLIAQLAERSEEGMSANLLWRIIASFGGYLNRKCDGLPGWKTL